MDKIFQAGEEFLEQSQGGGNQEHRGRYPPGGGYSGGDDEEHYSRAHQEARRHAGDSGNDEMFSNAIGSIRQNKSRLQDEDIDEEDAVRQHRRAYNDEDEQADSHSMGSAGAMQALKMFGGGAGGSQSQGDFMGMAMGEASKLFDSKAAAGKVSPDASKESAVQEAGEMALKMYMKSQGGGSGGLMSLASKFM